MDYSIRVPVTRKRKKILEEKVVSKKKLSRIKDYLFKPAGIDLKVFHPDKKWIRLREFVEGDFPSTLIKGEVIKTPSGYMDKKDKLGKGKTKDLFEKASKLGYEKWGEVATTSTEYRLDIGGVTAEVLSQDISPIGTFLKIESETQKGLDRALELLKVKESEKIEKNAAVLLGEKLGLI